MALSTLAEWTGSAIVSKIVDTAYSYLGERMLPADIEEELTRLKMALPKIKAIMSVSEALRFKYPNSGVNEWLNIFKEAFLAADDVLDELKYWELADKVKNQAQVSEPSSSILASCKRKFPSSNISTDTLGRLRNVVKMLDLTAAEVGNFFQFATALHGHSLAQPHCEASNISSRETTSFLTESKVFGRENERAKVIEWLKKPASHAHISAFSIVGPGGLGKTTLAQLIYKEIISTENHFDNIIWVCVSTSFNVEDITKKFLEELGEKSHGGESLNGLQKKLKEKVISKKVIFILDDVWNDDKMCDWEKLIAPLMFVQEGSKILLTTRMKSVAEMLALVLKIDTECLDFKGLEEQELLLLFNNYAFHGRNPNNHKDLQKIGEDIVKKLWGSPLAAKVIGSLLNSNMNFCYWKRILGCDTLINLEGARGVADLLKLSYFHLPTDLQECFKFCSIFHQDYEFDKNTLIRMWMASGFIRQQLRGNERPEEIGEEFFNNLLKKSFFEPHPSRKGYYIMHDLIHELAQNVSERECCRVSPKPNDQSVIPDTVQHVSIHRFQIEKVFHLKNLRTLIITIIPYLDLPKDQLVIPSGALKETLRVLHIRLLYNGTYEVQEEIGNLIHLRYLAITRGFGNFEPNPIYKLYHLQLLMLGEGNFETNEMTNLVSLRYLKLPYVMMENIKGLHKLTCLQELDFTVQQDSGHHIDELNTLHNLQQLSIKRIENVRDVDEAKKAELHKKGSLISLSLNWSEGSNNNPEEILDNLQPHQDLKELRIEGYGGKKSACWMRDPSPLDLSSLELSNCPLWEDLPSLAQMPNLRKLCLFKMSEVNKLDYSFDSARNNYAFPSLECLFCSCMPKWQSWAGLLTSYGFPNLRSLFIYECRNLTQLPALPLSLVSFHVQYVGLTSLPYIYNSSNATSTAPSSLRSSLRKVLICGCHNLESLNGFLQQENLDFQAFEELEISLCRNLVRLPTSAFQKFDTLKQLRITGSRKLLAVDNPRSLLPMKLRTLHLGDCGDLDMQLLELASHITTLQDLSIRYSTSITSIPFSRDSFVSLRKFEIVSCTKLIEYSFMEYNQGINPENNAAFLKINELFITHLSLLFIEPFRSLRFVTKCEVEECSEMETLPEQWLLQNSSTLKDFTINDASSLRSLPASLVRLTALRHLNILNVKTLEEIPVLPALFITWQESSDQTSSDQTSSDQASTDQSSSGKESSDHSDQASSDQESSYKSFSDQASPDQS